MFTATNLSATAAKRSRAGIALLGRDSPRGMQKQGRAWPCDRNTGAMRTTAHGSRTRAHEAVAPPGGSASQSYLRTMDDAAGEA
jgi:hypothetical protein